MVQAVGFQPMVGTVDSLMRCSSHAARITLAATLIGPRRPRSSGCRFVARAAMSERLLLRALAVQKE